MADPITNRLEVDLNLLADKQVEFLNDFVKKWDTAIDRLEEIVDRFQVGIGGDRRPGGASPTASTAATTTVRGPNGRPIVSSHSGINIGDLMESSIGDFVSQSGPSKSASRGFKGLFSKVSNRFDTFADKRDYESFEDSNDYLKAQFQLGSVPRGMIGGLQYMSWMAAHAANKNKQWEPYARVMGGTAQRMVTYRALYDTAKQLPIIGGLANSALSAVHQGLPTTQNLAKYSQYGVGAGHDTSGILGTPYLSQAWRAGVRANWEGYKRGSWGSLDGVPNIFMENPNYTRAQARETEEVIKKYGWSAKPLTFDQAQDFSKGTLDGTGWDDETTAALISNMGQGLLRQDLSHYTEKYRGVVTPDELMQMYDPVMRGQADLEDVRQTLDGLGSSAKAANMDLEVFKQQLDAVSASVSKSVGGTKSQVAKQISNLSAATGLTPKQLEPMLTSEVNYWRARSATGMDAWELENSDEGMNALMQANTAHLSSIIGSPEQWQRAQAAADRGDPRELKRLRGRAAEIRRKNPELFANMPAESFIDQVWMRDPEEQMRKSQAATDAQGATTEEELAEAMRAGGASEKDIAKLGVMADIKGWGIEEQSAKGSDLLKNIYHAYNDEMGLQQGTDSEYTITVDPKYAKFFKVVEQVGAEGSSFGKGNSNNKKDFGRNSSGVRWDIRADRYVKGLFN